MPWARFDDQFPDHPKVVKVGPLAAWLSVCAVCYCSRYLTDGFVPEAQLRKLADVKDPVSLAERLVDAGVWERCDGGFMVHDYLEYNPSRDAVLANRDTAKQRMSKRRSPEVRSNKQRTSSERSGEVREKFDDPVPVPLRPVVSIETTGAPPEPELLGEAMYPPSGAADAAVPMEQQRSRQRRTPPEPNATFAALQQFAEVIGGEDPAKLPASAKRQQLGVMKQLMNDYPLEDILGCARWLKSDEWRESKGLDIVTVRQAMVRWINAKRPTSHQPTSQARTAPTPHYYRPFPDAEGEVPKP